MNSTEPYSLEWVSLNFNQILTSRQTTFKTHRDNKQKTGLNALANRMAILNGKIPLAWLNLNFETYKLKCKVNFL